MRAEDRLLALGDDEIVFPVERTRAQGFGCSAFAFAVVAKRSCVS
jgi:hypothetical protein